MPEVSEESLSHWSGVSCSHVDRFEMSCYAVSGMSVRSLVHHDKYCKSGSSDMPPGLFAVRFH